MSENFDVKDEHRLGLLPDDPFEGAPVSSEPASGIAEKAQTAAEDELFRPIDAFFEAGEKTCEARASGQEKPIPVPWAQLRGILRGGLWPGVYVLVGGTGAGKTTFASQLIIEAAGQGFPTVYVGLELNEAQLGLRLLAEKSNVASGKAAVSWSALYTGKAKATELELTRAARATMKEWPLYGAMGSAMGWPASRLEQMGKRLAEKHPNTTRLIVLDFLQLVGNEPGDKRTELRERIGRAAYAAAQVASRYNTAVVLINSAARDKYSLLGSKAILDEAGLFTKEVESGTAFRKEELGFIGCPEALIGLGKESGEIEYSADAVIVLGKCPNADGAPVRVCAVPKLRFGAPRWFPMLFNDQRFTECEFSLVPSKEPAAKSSKANGQAKPNSGGNTSTAKGIDLDASRF